MILVASGHPGVDRFIRGNNTEVLSAAAWADALPHFLKAEKVLIGQNLPDFAAALDWLKQNRAAAAQREIVLWVGEQFHHPLVDGGSEHLVVWRGELDESRLADWWRSQPSLSFDLDRRWIVISAFPYRSVEPLVRALGRSAENTFGRGGGWVDLDWMRAEISMALHPRIYERADFAFEKMLPQRLRDNYVVPAPPPWRPGTKSPEFRDLDSLLSLQWPWQGWHLGAQIGTPWMLHLLEDIACVMVWAAASTPVTTVERIEGFCRLYRPDLSFVVASENDLSGAMAHPAQGWRFISLDGLAAAPDAPALARFFQKSRRKKE